MSMFLDFLTGRNKAKKTDSNIKNEPDIAVKSISREQLRYLATGIIDDLVKGSSWLSLNDRHSLIKAWDSIADLRTIISKISNYFIRVEIKHYKETRSGIKDISNKSNLIKVLNNPNPYQNRNEFLEELYGFWNVTGENFIYVNGGGVGFESNYEKLKGLYNLNPVVTDKAIRKQNSINAIIPEKQRDIIDKYLYKINNNSLINFDRDKIININDVNLNPDDGLGRYRGNSKLRSQKPQLTNLKVAYEAKNVLLAKRGALGIFSSAGRNEYAFPLTNEEQEKIQEKWANYGLSSDQWQVIFTKASLVWQQIAMPTKDLQLYEGLEDDRQSLCSAYSLPYLLFKNGGDSGATFSNLDTASKQVYREKVIPDWGTIQESFNKYFKLKEKGEYIKFDYSHIDVLQPDQKVLTENKNLKSEGITKLLVSYNENSISEQQLKYQLKMIYELSDETIKDLLKKPENNTQETIDNTISN